MFVLMNNNSMVYCKREIVNNISRKRCSGKKYEVILMDYAVLSNENSFTVFQFKNYRIRFKAPYSLERYTGVKKWDNGYLVVMAKYKHNKADEEEYIDLIPILQKLYIDTNSFLSQIKEVRIKDA